MTIMCNKILSVSLVLLFIVMRSESQISKNEMFMSTPKLIASNDYPVERHQVTTRDDYILQMHRIPAGRRSPRKTADQQSKGKNALLLIHGLFGSSGDFITMGRKKSLGYMLADAGFDVWLGNLRGNYYTGHRTLNRSDPRFWEFSFEEHGKYDAPAMIDKVLNVTGHQKIIYIGYSMGTTTFFTFMSSHPEYKSKIVSFIALAPAVYLDNVKPLATMFLKNMNIPDIMRSRGFISATFEPEFKKFLGTLCNFRNPKTDVCSSLINLVVGEDNEQTDPDVRYMLVARMEPASWRQIEHYGKIALTGEFTSWEDGLWGAVKPYNLSNVQVPVTLILGENDQLTERAQIMRLAEKLNRTTSVHLKSCIWPKFNHLDFNFAIDVDKLVNKPLIKHINVLFNKYAYN
ncbi:lipase 3 [Bombyx mori]|uniref:Lipase n=1 Tax=Bombyx mori TaxID=7091 RepID=A0A8R2AL99_BOMMO|nr:lipase 3 [Bombyx mori]